MSKLNLYDIERIVQALNCLKVKMENHNNPKYKPNWKESIDHIDQIITKLTQPRLGGL